MANLGAADIDSRLEEQLIDGILYAFQEQTNEVCNIIANQYKIKTLMMSFCAMKGLPNISINITNPT